MKFEKMEILWETCYKTEKENNFLTKIKINNFQENPSNRKAINQEKQRGMRTCR